MTQTALFQALQRNRFPTRAGGSGIRAGLGRLGKGPWNDRTPDLCCGALWGPPPRWDSHPRIAHHIIPKPERATFPRPSHPMTHLFPGTPSQEPTHTRTRAPDGPTGKQAENFGRGQFPFLFSAKPPSAISTLLPIAVAIASRTRTRGLSHHHHPTTPPTTATMHAAGVVIIVILLLLLAAATGWIVFTRMRAQRLGVRPPLPSPKPPPTQLTPRLPAPPAPSFLLHPLPPLVFVPLRRAHPRPRRHRRVVQRPRARLQEPEQPDGGGRLRGVAFDQRARSRSR